MVTDIEDASEALLTAQECNSTFTRKLTQVIQCDLGVEPRPSSVTD